MLKKIIVFIAATLAGIAVFAAPVSQEAAMGYAKSYFGSSAATLVWNGEDAATRSSEAPAFYVFNNPAGGWVIISGDDTVQPVLGYSRTGAFRSTGMPSNLKWWMERTAGNVRKARTAGKTPAAVKTAWANVGVRTKATGGKLLQTANWDQTAPYNNECPMDGSSRSLTGCVATAMAIVMRYNQWPSAGKGTAPSYYDEWLGKTLEARSVEHTYNWNNMPLTDGARTSGWTASQKNAVAQLMRDCGQIVQMWYGADGSGAASSDIPPAMAEYMSYKATAQELFRYDYKPSVWLGMLKAEIDGNHPLIYGGSSTDGGHQFICDGYDAAGNIHINWGWGGDNNGYYPVCYVGDESDAGMLFNIDDSAIFGLVPATSGAGTSTAVLELEADEGFQGVSLVSGTVAKGSSFTLDVGYISNYNESDYNGAIKIALVDKEGKLKEFISDEKALSLKAYGGYYADDWYGSVKGVSCRISGDVALTDAVDVFYKLSDGSWARIGATRFYGDSDDYYNYTGKNAYLYTVCPMGVMDVPMIYTKDSYAAGENLYFELAYGQRHPSSIAWYYDGAAQSKDYVKLVSGKHTVKAAVKYDDGSSDTVTATISVK